VCGAALSIKARGLTCATSQAASNRDRNPN